MTRLAERYGVAPRQLQARRSVRMAKLTSPARSAAHARAAATCGRQSGGGGDAPAAAGVASATSSSEAAAMRRTIGQASLSHVIESRGTVPTHALPTHALSHPAGDPGR